MTAQLAIEDQGATGPHVHRDLVPIRENGDGTRLATICPGCFSLFHPISGRPLQRDGRKWQAAVNQMRRDLAGARRDRTPVGRMAAWVKEQK